MKTITANLPTPDQDEKDRKKMSKARDAKAIQDIFLSLVDYGDNVRKGKYHNLAEWIDTPEKYPDEIKELAESIQKVGLINPVVLVPCGPRYNIETGHRRYLAFRYLYSKVPSAIIPAFVRPDDYDSSNLGTIQLIENIQREDLAPLELEIAVTDMVKAKDGDCDAVAHMLGKSIRWVRRIVDAAALRASLPPELQNQAQELSSRTLAEAATLGPKAAPDAVQEALDLKRKREEEKKKAKEEGKRAPAVKNSPAITITVKITDSGIVSVKSSFPLPAESEAVFRAEAEKIYKGKEKA